MNSYFFQSLSWLFQLAYFVKCKWTLLELNFYQPYPSSRREWILSLLVYVLHKTWNQAFSRVVVQLTAKKCTKKRDARAKLLFCLVKLILIWLSRRRRILNFLLSIWSVKNRIFSGQIQLLLLIASQTVFRLIGSSLASFLVNRVENKSFFCTWRVIVRENRTVPKDWGQPISFIFSALRTKLIRLTLVTLTRFPGFSLSRLTTPLVFGQGKP